MPGFSLTTMLQPIPVKNLDHQDTLIRQAVFDGQELFERLDRDEELFREVLEAFVHDLPNLVQALQHALDGEDMELIHSAAHKLKGALANVSFKQLCELTRQIEYAAGQRDRQTINQLSGLLAPFADKAIADIQQRLDAAEI